LATLAASGSEALAGLANARYVTPRALAESAAPLRNGIEPRGGVAFDGTNGQRVTSLLTGQNVGTDPLALSLVVDVPAVNPATSLGIAFLCANGPADNVGQANTFEVSITTGGSLRLFSRSDPGGTGKAEANVANNLVANWGGRRVHVVVVRNAVGSPSVYIDAALQTLTAEGLAGGRTWQTTVTSNYLQLGWHTSSALFVGRIYSATLYNLALTAADVLEIYELGGAVPERFKFGSQAARYSSDFSAGVNSWGADNFTPAGNIDANADGAGVPPSNDWLRGVTDGTERAYMYTAPMTNYIAGFPIKLPGSRFRVLADVFCETASGATHAAVENFGNGSAVAYAPITPGSVSAVNVELTAGSAGLPRFTVSLNTGGSGSTLYPSGTRLYVKNFRAVELGAVVHLPLNDGAGLQLRDDSTNALHALMTTTGVSHVLPKPGGAFPVRTTTNTNGNQQLCGGSCVPLNCQVLRIRARTRSGSATVSLGNVSGGAQLVSSAALTTAWAQLPIVGTNHITTTQNLWAASNSTNVVEWDIELEELRT
jgi:hypothetical protein